MPDVSTLLAEADWLTRLARRLVGRDDADDIVQETYVAALRSPPDPDRLARPWLRRVMVNIVRMRHRGRVRRDAREQAAVVAESPTPEQALERARVERALADLVLALEEPTRSTVLLRYREGLSAEAVATQQGISVRTVRRRLREAVERLRDGMDSREHAKAWRAAFAPFLVPRAAAPVPWWGLFVMKKLLAVLVIAIVALYFGGKVVRQRRTTTLSTETLRAQTPLAIVNRSIDTSKPPASAAEDLVGVPGCVHLRGAVSDGSGAPIPHARITVRRKQGARESGVDANNDGHYDVCAHFGTLMVEFTAIGFSGITTRVTFATDSTRDVQLLPEAIIAGTVVTADGVPLVNAEVTVDPLRKVAFMAERPVKTTTDASGAFRIGGISPGRNVLVVGAAGFTGRQLELVIGAGETREGILVRMNRGARISGRVMDHGTPVVGANISIRAPSAPIHAGILATTTSDGSFTIDRAPHGQLGLIVDLFHVESPTSIVIGETEAHVVVEVSALGIVQGTVTDQGAPVADAVVSCPGGVADNIGELTTKSDGRYRCPGFKPGEFGVAARDVHGRWGIAHGSIENGETKSFDIELANDGMLCGTVHDKAGAPASGIVIGANDSTQEDSGEAIVASDGAFCIRELANKGTYVLSATLDGQPIVLDHAPVQLDHRAEVAIVIGLALGTIAGNVVDRTGAPVADAVIRPGRVIANGDFAFDANRGAVTITDHTGHFSLERLPAGSYRIFALGRDGSATSTDAITTGTSTVKIVLAAAGSIQGTLVGFSTTPIVTGTSMAGGRENVDFEVDGASFKATGLAPGDYTLQVDTFGHDADAHRVTVRSGEATQVTLSSRGTANVDATVVDWKTNAPRPDIRCSPPVAVEQGNVGGVYNVVDSQAISDPHGHLAMTNVSAGEVVILCVGANLFGGRALILPRDRTTTTTLLIVARDPANHSIGARINVVARTIDRIDDDGAAAHAGLQLGDEVEAVDGRAVSGLFGEPLLAVITNRPVGTLAKLTVNRSGVIREIAVAVGNP